MINVTLTSDYNRIELCNDYNESLELAITPDYHYLMGRDVIRSAKVLMTDKRSVFKPTTEYMRITPGEWVARIRKDSLSNGCMGVVPSIIDHEILIPIPPLITSPYGYDHTQYGWVGKSDFDYVTKEYGILLTDITEIYPHVLPGPGTKITLSDKVLGLFNKSSKFYKLLTSDLVLSRTSNKGDGILITVGDRVPGWMNRGDASHFVLNENDMLLQTFAGTLEADTPDFWLSIFPASNNVTLFVKSFDKLKEVLSDSFNIIKPSDEVLIKFANDMWGSESGYTDDLFVDSFLNLLLKDQVNQDISKTICVINDTLVPVTTNKKSHTYYSLPMALAAVLHESSLFTKLTPLTQHKLTAVTMDW